MPVYLPQTSRREFLKRTLLAGAGLTLAPSLYAGLFGKSRDKHTFAFFSDAHIAADATTIQHGVNMTDQFIAAVRDLFAWPVRPAALIINGDLAFQDGLPGDYVAFGKLIEPVRSLAPIYLSLGNHDQRDHFWSAFPHDRAAQKNTLRRQAAVFSSDRANWFQLDSLDVTDASSGELGSDQINWLSRELAARPEKPAIIVGHHNLQSPDTTSCLKDSAALEEIFVRHRQVKAYVYGHTHDWHVTQHPAGVHLVNLPPTAYVFKAGRPSGWVRATLAKDGAEFELRSLDPKHPEHGQVKKLQWRTA
jgi:Icc protein